MTFLGGGGEGGEDSNLFMFLRVREDMLEIVASTGFQLCFQLVIRIARSCT